MNFQSQSADDISESLTQSLPEYLNKQIPIQSQKAYSKPKQQNNPNQALDLASNSIGAKGEIYLDRNLQKLELVPSMKFNQQQSHGKINLNNPSKMNIFAQKFRQKQVEKYTQQAKQLNTQKIVDKEECSDSFLQKLNQFQYIPERQTQKIIHTKGNTPKISLKFDKKDLLIETERKQIIKKNYLISRQLIQTQKKVEIVVFKQDKKVKSFGSVHHVYFPFQPYQIQKTYMEKLLTALQNKENCLLQSPTGTGKTQCLLNGVLSWVQSDYQRRLMSQNKLEVSKTKIIYLSRTHSQLKQVQNELSKTCFRPTMAIFGSRDQLCINNSLEQLKGSEKNEQCYKAIKVGNKVKKMRMVGNQPSQQLIQKMCKYHIPESETINISKQFLQKQIVDLQRIKWEGQKLKFCPYFYPFHLKHEADIFFMPYNYLLNGQLLGKYSEMVINSIIIFDQAHNVSQAACSGRNINLTHNLLIQAIKQININQKLSPASEQLFNARQTIGSQMAYIQRQCEAWLKLISNTFQQTVVSEQFSSRKTNDDEKSFCKAIPYSKTIQYFFQLFLDPGDFSDQKVQKYMDSKGKSAQLLRQMENEIVRKIHPFVGKILTVIGELEKTIDGTYQNLDKLASFFKKILQLTVSVTKNSNPLEQQRFHFRLFLKKDNLDEKKAFTIELVCLTPSLTFQKLLQLNPRNIILTSGTLAPMHTWSRQLKVPFAYELQNKHVIKPQQLKLMIVKKGLKQNQLNFSYANTNNNKGIFIDLAHTIVSLLEKIPNGVLVVFPSYKIIRQFQFQLRTQKLYGKLNQCKHIYTQTKSQSQDYLKQYIIKAKQEGAVMFCVCRGKVSEGMDFSDQLCRAVIFVGVPYPNIKDPWITQKKSYLSDLSRRTCGEQFKSITGDQWYDLQTMRAVNQAIGRVIRHANDFGTIYLLDQRYSSEKLKKYFPKWSLESLQYHQNCLKTLSQTEKFFQQFSKKRMIKISKPIQHKAEKVNAFNLLMGKKEKKH